MKRYKVWAVKPWGERGEQLITSGYPHDEEKLLLLRTGSLESRGEPFELVEPFYGRPMQAVALAYERTGYVGIVMVKDFDDDSWHTGTIGSLGTFALVPGKCPETFSAAGMYPADWPRCPSCGDFALDGHVTCGRLECGERNYR